MNDDLTAIPGYDRGRDHGPAVLDLFEGAGFHMVAPEAITQTVASGWAAFAENSRPAVIRSLRD